MDPLISVNALADMLRREAAPTLLDVRWRLSGRPGRLDYERGHLPGAVFVDLDSELAAPPGPSGRHPLPEPAAFGAAMRRAGVDSSQPVIVYDDGDGSVAARAWWLLRWAGHREVAVLDGGYAAGVDHGLPITTVEPTPEDGDFEVAAGAMPVVDADGAAELAGEGSLLDARAPERYRGEHEPVDPKAGHVPGAVNAPFAEHLTSEGTWRAPAELAEHFTRLGVRQDRPVGAYCGSGVTACSVVLALEHAGLTSADQPARLYAGSWSNWSQDPDRPVRRGDG